MLLNPRPQIGRFGGIQAPSMPRSPMMPGIGGFNPGTVSLAPRPIAGPMPVQPGIGRYPMLSARPVLGSFKNGGKVKKTGLYKLHAGEKVTSLKQLMGAK